MADRTVFEPINNGDHLAEGYFNGILKKEILTELIPNGTPNTGSSFDTLASVDISSETSVYSYKFNYQFYFSLDCTGYSGTGNYQMIITFDDASTETVTLPNQSANSAGSRVTIGSYNGTKRIETVDIQGKVTTGAPSYTTNITTSNNSVTSSDVSGLFQSYIRFY